MYVLKRDVSKTSWPTSNPYLISNNNRYVRYTEDLSEATKFQSIPQLLRFVGEWNQNRNGGINGGDHLHIVRVERHDWQEVEEVT